MKDWLIRKELRACMSEKVNVKYCKIRQQLIYISHNQPTIKKKYIFCLLKVVPSKCGSECEREQFGRIETETERNFISRCRFDSLSYTMTNSNWGINRANKSDRTYNKLVFLMGDIKSGRKTEYFFLLLLFCRSFSSFLLITKTDIYFIHESRCVLCCETCLLFFFFLLCFLKSVHECLYIKCYKYTCYYFYNKNVSSQLNWYTYKLFRQQNENKMWLMSCVNILMLFYFILFLLLVVLPSFFFFFALTINCFVPKNIK